MIRHSWAQERRPEGSSVLRKNLSRSFILHHGLPQLPATPTLSTLPSIVYCVCTVDIQPPQYVLHMHTYSLSIFVAADSRRPSLCSTLVFMSVCVVSVFPYGNILLCPDLRCAPSVLSCTSSSSPAGGARCLVWRSHRRLPVGELRDSGECQHSVVVHDWPHHE